MWFYGTRCNRSWSVNNRYKLYYRTAAYYFLEVDRALARKQGCVCIENCKTPCKPQSIASCTPCSPPALVRIECRCQCPTPSPPLSPTWDQSPEPEIPSPAMALPTPIRFDSPPQGSVSADSAIGMAPRDSHHSTSQITVVTTVTMPDGTSIVTTTYMDPPSCQYCGNNLNHSSGFSDSAVDGSD